MNQVITIIGAGKGISHAVARRFAREGYAAALISRNPSNLTSEVKAIQELGVECLSFAADAADSSQLVSALEGVESALGATQVLHYNAAAIKMKNILEEDADSLTADFQVNVAAALTAVRHVIPKMESGKSSILLTGGGFAMHPMPDFGSLAVGKAGIRNLTDSLNQALQKKGIFSGTVTVCGLVKPEDAKYNPENIAEQFWNLHTERDKWEIVF